MDRFSELRAFVAVIDAGGFSAAAREMDQSRSSVNRLVIALEARLGSHLLNRTTRSVSATSAGRGLYERARQLLEDLDEIERAVSDTATEPRGRLRLSAPPAFGDLDFSQLVADFLRRYPGVELDVTFESRVIDLVAEGYDLAIRIAAPDEETHLVDHRILELTYVMCASDAYLAERGVPETLADLREHALLHLRQPEQAQHWTFMGKDGSFNMPVRPVLISNNLDSLRNAACEGLGIAVLPEYAVRSDIVSGRLHRVLAEYDLPPRMLQVIYPPMRHLSARVTVFTEFVRDWCGKA